MLTLEKILALLKRRCIPQILNTEYKINIEVAVLVF